MQLYDAADSLRPPNWRCLNAQALLKSGSSSPPGLDQDTHRLVSYLRGLQSAKTSQDRARLLQRSSVTSAL